MKFKWFFKSLASLAALLITHTSVMYMPCLRATVIA